MINDLRIFDAHMHIFGRFKPRNVSLTDYMDSFGIDRAIITAVNEATNLNALLTTESDIDDEEFMEKFSPSHQYDHELVRKEVGTHPERLTGFYWFNPRIATKKDWETLDKYITEYKFKGVKIQPYVDMLKVPEDLHQLAEFCVNKNVPLFAHSGTPFFFQEMIRARHYHEFIQHHQELRLVLLHSAFTMAHCINCLRYFPKISNVYFETSVSIPYGIMTLIKAMGADRVIYGSDAPAANPPDIEMQKIFLLNFDKETLEKVFYGNITKLLGEN